MSVETTTTRDEDTSLAELDPDQLTDSDELYHMAQAMRDDEYFEVPIVDWEKKNDAVMVTIITPNGETAKVQETWPEKPTTDNNFIRACMCALNVDSAKDAALMADDLQDVSHADFTVPADKAEYHGWELKPEVDMPQSLRTTVREYATGDTDTDGLDPFLRFLSLLGGPVSLALTIGGHRFAEPGNWWTDDKTATEMFSYVQATWYAMWGTVLWIIVALLLL